MGRFRITIARLLLIIVYFGVGFAAMRSPSWIWASTLFSLVTTSMAAATLTAVYRLGAGGPSGRASPSAGGSTWG